MESKQSEEAAGDGAERDLGVGDGEPAGGLSRTDVAQGARCESSGSVEELESGAGEEAGDIRVGPGKTAGDAQRDGEHFRGIVETGAGGIDHSRPAFED